MISFNPELATEEEEASVAQHVKHVIDDSKKILVPDADTILAAWGLIDADPALVFSLLYYNSLSRKN